MIIYTIISKGPLYLIQDIPPYIIDDIHKTACLSVKYWYNSPSFKHTNIIPILKNKKLATETK